MSNRMKTPQHNTSPFLVSGAANEKQKLHRHHDGRILSYFSVVADDTVFEFAKLLQGYCMIKPERDRFFLDESEITKHVSKNYIIIPPPAEKSQQQGGQR